ncbi:hypothetical protein M1N58_02630 [Dehalococcoidales bacterium]|nr:hypothetical protein [Dehalococcoidales bacterium]
MGVLRRIAIAIGITIQSFIVLFLAITLIATIITFNEMVTDAYEDGYNEGYAQTYDVRYRESYNQGYDKGYDQGFQSGLETGYKEGLATRVDLRNPTYKELMDFLRRDKTDLKPYIKGEYTCSNFSADVNINAELEGIRAAWVRLRFADEEVRGHAIVAFETIDKGLIFIEPQTDEIAKPVIGESYWQSVGRTRPTDYDDTVVEIQIIW